MKEQDVKIVPYAEAHSAQLLQVWEQSVLATHRFLTPADFQSIKDFMQTVDFKAFAVYCLVREDEVVGFLGVAAQKIEMLFLAPACMGQGMGKKLMDFALGALKADQVDVNEQNTKAVEFYQKFGFKTYARTDKDDQGKGYPLLRMRLETDARG